MEERKKTGIHGDMALPFGSLTVWTIAAIWIRLLF